MFSMVGTLYTVHVFLLVTLLILGEVRSDFTLTVLHTNDVHARFDPFTSRGSMCKEDDAQAGKCFGGLARRFKAVDKLRNSPREPNIVLLDAGDQFQGTMWFYVHQGRAASHFMNKLKYDAMALGNHEFDRNIEGLVPFLQNVTFPILSSNIDVSEEPEMAGLVAKSTVISIGGEQIGIIGYTTKDTTILSNPGKIKFLDEVQSIKEEAEKLTSQGINKLIALGHAGIDVDRRIATSIPGIDLVVGGHTNTFLYNGKSPAGDEQEGPYPLVLHQNGGGRALVVQDYAFGKYLGHLQVTFDDLGEVTDWDGNPILLDNNTVEDAAILAEMESWKKPLEAASKEVIGRTHVHLDGDRASCRLHECNMGNLVADGMVHQHLAHPDDGYWADVGLAIVGGGAIRASIEPGSVTARDIQEVQPFSNTIDLVELQGRHLLEVFEHSVMDYDTEVKRGKFLQVSGFRVKYDLSKPNGQRVVSVDVRCANCTIPRFEPLEEEAYYKFVTTGFIIRGGDGYYMIPENMRAHHIFGDVDSDVLLEYVTATSPITIGLEGRIQFMQQSTDNDLNVSKCTSGAINICLGATLMWWTVILTIYLFRSKI